MFFFVAGTSVVGAKVGRLGEAVQGSILNCVYTVRGEQG